ACDLSAWLHPKSYQAELVALGVRHDDTHSFGILAHLTHLAATEVFYESYRGIKVVSPKVKVDARLANLPLPDRLKVDYWSAGHDRADATPRCLAVALRRRIHQHSPECRDTLGLEAVNRDLT